MGKPSLFMESKAVVEWLARFGVTGRVRRVEIVIDADGPSQMTVFRYSEPDEILSIPLRHESIVDVA